MAEQNQQANQGKSEQEPIPQGYFIPVQSPDIEKEVNLLDLWHVLVGYKRLITIIIFISILLAVTVAVLTTPIFRADVVLASTANEGGGGGRFSNLARQFGGLADLTGISLKSSSNIETTMATLKSRRFIAGFISERNLKPILFDEIWDGENKKWLAQSPSIISRLKSVILPSQISSSDTVEQLAPGEPSMWDAYKLFNQAVIVSRDIKTGLVTLQVEWKDPQLASQWANALVQRLNNELRQQAIDENERGIRYLEDQIHKTSLADLRTILYRLVEEHTKTITLAKVNEQYALKVIDPAVAPQDPVKPKRTLTVILGLIIGLMMGVLIALAVNFIRRNRSIH